MDFGFCFLAVFLYTENRLDAGDVVGMAFQLLHLIGNVVLHGVGNFYVMSADIDLHRPLLNRGLDVTATKA